MYYIIDIKIKKRSIYYFIEITVRIYFEIVIFSYKLGFKIIFRE